MKTLPPPAARKPVHTRTVTFEGYSREDGLWDVEAEMRDTKAYAMETLDGAALVPGQPIHHMKIRMTLDDGYVIRDLQAVTIDAPFGECQAGVPPLQQMVGVRIGKGWREVIESRLGGVRGCTHLRELLFSMATPAFQTIPHFTEHVRGPVPVQEGNPPMFMGRCIAWDFDGAVVKRVAPEFAGYRRR
jgi:hypothetical protein